MRRIQGPDHELRQKVIDHLKLGMSYRQVIDATGASMGLVGKVIRINGGVVPRPKTRSELRLSLAEREEISRRLPAGDSLRAIAQLLGRNVSTISREVATNGGREKYRAWAAEQRAENMAQRPKPAKLVTCSRLKKVVQAQLKELYSPRQISERLVVDFPDDPEMRISHEAIYQSLFIQGRGALKRELTACLRTGRTVRKPQRREIGKRGGIKDMVMISERPAEVEDRAIPGHWESDLILGKDGTSQIGTLVERSTRYVMLLKLKDKRAETMRKALMKAVTRLPEELFKSLTHDQGKEMAQHAQFTVDTGVQIYFCDPHSPWQRGSNENTNGLLRQYFPKGTTLSGFSEKQLDAVARQLNGRPRETLGWRTPAEKLDELLR